MDTTSSPPAPAGAGDTPGPGRQGPPTGSLDGRVALVTGAGRGIGEEIAHALARCGAAVIVNDLLPERAQAVADAVARLGGRARPAPFDVTDVAAVEGGVRAATAVTGPVDVLVNNAGLPVDGLRRSPFVTSDPAEWSRVLDVALHGVLNVTRAVAAGMCDRRWGRIVSVSSEAGRVGMDIGVSIYAAAKAGVNGFTRHLALEVASTGVTANSISIGFMENRHKRSDYRPEVPLGRLGEPRDIAGAVLFLASEAGAWITGQTLVVNGGSHVS